MASDDRLQATDLTVLTEKATQYDFHQIIRVISRLYTHKNQFRLRYLTNASLSMQSTQIASLNVINENEINHFLICVNFFGLTGPSGVLPSFYTSLMIKQLRMHDNALKSFIDIFNNRLLNLYHQVWARSKFFMQMESSILQKSTVDNPFVNALKSLIGHSTDHISHRMSFSDDVFYNFAGVISANTRSASMIRSVLRGAIRLPVEIIEIVPQWITIPKAERSTITSRVSQNVYNVLGQSVLLGKKVLSFQNQFRVRLGPMSLGHYKQLLPGGTNYIKLVELIRYLVGVVLDFSIQLVLRAEEVPLCRLSSHNPLCLGQTTWLHANPMQYDVDDTILYVNDIKQMEY